MPEVSGDASGGSPIRFDPTDPRSKDQSRPNSEATDA